MTKRQVHAQARINLSGQRELLSSAVWLPSNVRQDALKFVPYTVLSMRDAPLAGEVHIDFPKCCKEILDNEMWCVGTAIGLHKCQAAHSLYGLQVLDPKYGWSRSMLTALKHFVRFVSSKATEFANEVRSR